MVLIQDDKRNEKNVESVSSERLVKEIGVLSVLNGLVRWQILRSEFVKVFRDRYTDDDIKRDLE